MTELNLKDLWLKQTVTEPKLEDLLQKLKKYKRQSLLKLLFTNLLLLGTTTFIIVIWYYVKPQFISTIVGISLILFSMVLFLFAYNKQLPGFNKIDVTQTTSNYLQNLIALKNKQHFIQTKILSVYFLMLSIGICLYMIEYALRMTVLQAAFTYTLTLLWIGFNWFYIRPKTIKKQQTKLNELIDKFKTSTKQLNEIN